MKSAKNTLILFVLPALFIIQSCTIKKETVITERQAPANISDSLKVQSSHLSKQTVTIKKSSLEKAFMMTPTIIYAERIPQFNDFKPVIVSFERAGNKIGLYRLSSDNIYASIPTDKLLQSFDIITETENEITFDLSAGLKGLILETHMNIVDKNSFKIANDNAADGIYSGLSIEEALIKKVELTDNTIFIEQAIKISDLEISKEATSSNAENKKQTISKKNKNLSVLIELKPYPISTNFKSKLYDRSQRVGYFVNFATQAKVDYVLPQIMKWDLSENKGPIIIALEKTIPTEIKQAVIEGVLYWNKVIGRNVLQIQEGFTATDRLKDRMIVIRWVLWDSAGFAYASLQADPITGENLRGQIFMTSSWLKHAQKTVELPTDIKKLNGLCLFEQNKLDINKIYTNISPEKRKKMTEDIIRMVVAHEMGHVMGLRHNFTGSVNHTGTDKDLINAESDYLKDVNHPGFAFSTTVMDYERNIHTALLGAVIKSKVLTYDKAAIDWGYFDAPITLAENTYCSDEHISLAQTLTAEIYGCQRFDAYKNVLLYPMTTIQNSMRSFSEKTFAAILENEKNANPYTKKADIEKVISNKIELYEEISILNKYLFSSSKKTKLITIDQAVSPFADDILNINVTEFSKAPALSFKIQEDMKALGGLSQMLNDLMTETGSIKDFYQKQVNEFFEVLINQPVDLSDVQIADIEKLMLTQAKIKDRQIEVLLLKEFLPVKKVAGIGAMPDITMYSLNPTAYKLENIRYSDSLHIGDAKLLLSYFQRPITIRSASATLVKVNESEIQIHLLDNSASMEFDNLLIAFEKMNWPYTAQQTIGPVIDESVQNIKAAAAVNTLEILKLAKIETPVTLNHSALADALETVDFNLITGVTKAELESELEIILKLENLKPTLD